VPTLFYSVTRNTRAGTVFLKVVNRAAAPQPVRIEFTGLKTVESKGQASSSHESLAVGVTE
jgi:hypothetical protein